MLLQERHGVPGEGTDALADGGEGRVRNGDAKGGESDHGGHYRPLPPALGEVDATLRLRVI
jgi:hypothetical protein